MVIPTSLTMTNKGQKYMYLGYNIRDFRQLLKSLHPQLPHLACKHEKTNKNSQFQILVCHL